MGLKAHRWAVCKLTDKDPEILETFVHDHEAAAKLAELRDAHEYPENYNFVMVPFERKQPLFPPGVDLKARG